MITIESLTHIHPGSRGTAPRTALQDVSLSIAEGSFTILAGPNGSGKSTLFRLLCGLASPSAGRITIGGHDVLKNPAQARALMAVVFQAPAVDKHLSVGENLALHGRLYGLSGAAYREREEEALAWTMLKDRLKDKVGTLSGGLSRQVELAKCLLTRPQLLLLDEPTTGLDPAGRRAFLDTLLSLQRERAMTVLMTTHIFSEAEQADEVLILKEGRLIAQDRPSVLRSSLGRDVVVATAPTPEAARQLAPAFDAALGVTCRLHGEELRIEELPEDGPVALIDRILSQYRDQLSAVAVKQPTLEDVFIHLTASTPDPELAEAASS